MIFYSTFSASFSIFWSSARSGVVVSIYSDSLGSPPLTSSSITASSSSFFSSYLIGVGVGVGVTASYLIMSWMISLLTYCRYSIFFFNFVSIFDSLDYGFVIVFFETFSFTTFSFAVFFFLPSALVNGLMSSNGCSATGAVAVGTDTWSTFYS